MASRNFYRQALFLGDLLDQHRRTLAAAGQEQERLNAVFGLLREHVRESLVVGSVYHTKTLGTGLRRLECSPGSLRAEASWSAVVLCCLAQQR